MSKYSHATTFGRRDRWNSPPHLSPGYAEKLRVADLETGFDEESGLVHEKSCQSNVSHGACLNGETRHHFVTSYGTRVPARNSATGRVWHANQERVHDTSPTSVQSDLTQMDAFTKVSTTIAVPLSRTSPSFPFDTNGALPRNHNDELSLNVYWDVNQLVEKYALHDDEIMIRLEEGMISF